MWILNHLSLEIGHIWSKIDGNPWNFDNVVLLESD